MLPVIKVSILFLIFISNSFAEFNSDPNGFKIIVDNNTPGLKFDTDKDNNGAKSNFDSQFDNAKSDFDKRFNDGFNFIRAIWIFGLVLFVVVLLFICYFWCHFFRICESAVENEGCSTVHHSYTIGASPQQPDCQPGYNPQAYPQTQQMPTYPPAYDTVYSTQTGSTNYGYKPS